MKLRVGKASVALGSAFVGFVILNLALVVAVIWVAAHFIHKFW